jgi:hypothetical protein
VCQNGLVYCQFVIASISAYLDTIVMIAS